MGDFFEGDIDEFFNDIEVNNLVPIDVPGFQVAVNSEAAFNDEDVFQNAYTASVPFLIGNVPQNQNNIIPNIETINDNIEHIFLAFLSKRYLVRGIAVIDSIIWIFCFYIYYLLRQYFTGDNPNPNLNLVWILQQNQGFDFRFAIREDNNLPRWIQSNYFVVPPNCYVMAEYTHAFYRVLYHQFRAFLQYRPSLEEILSGLQGVPFDFRLTIYAPYAGGREARRRRIQTLRNNEARGHGQNELILPLLELHNAEQDAMWEQVYQQNREVDFYPGFYDEPFDFLGGIYESLEKVNVWNELGIKVLTSETNQCFVLAFQHALRREWIVQHGRVVDVKEYFVPIIYSEPVFHRYAEQLFGRSFSCRTWEEAFPIYSQIFSVNIHVFMIGKSSRQRCFLSTSHVHIYIYFRSFHVDAIISPRKLLQCKSLLGYCDLCGHVQQQSKERCLRHMNECLVGNRKAMSFQLKTTLKKQFHQSFQRVQKEKIVKIKPYCYLCGSFESFCQHNKFLEEVHRCGICYSKMCLSDLNGHQCELKAPKMVDGCCNESLWVVDIESKQIQRGESIFTHECILICCRPMYGKQHKFQFRTEKEFVTFLESWKFGMTEISFFAHNGGGYDYPFFLRELEKTYRVEIVPCPHSFHKYLSLQVKIGTTTFTFLDFMRLVPGSLKGIAKSFQLNVQKGDFPHRFFSFFPLEYEGAFPSLRTDYDFFCLHDKKDQKDVEEVYQWFQDEIVPFYCTCWNQECTCQKPPWKAYSFLVDYCWQDVDVLAEACVAYRQFLLEPSEGQGWNWKYHAVDPFQCMTQSQIAMKVFSQGCLDSHEKVFIFQPKIKRIWKIYCYLEGLPYHVQHGGNGKEYFCYEIDSFVHGCSVPKKQMFFFYGEEEGCFSYEQCISFKMKLFQWEVFCIDISSLNYEEEDPNRWEFFTDREIFYGGRTDVFSSYCNNSEEDIHYIDVCSLYPYVCAFKMLPIGVPTYLIGKDIDARRLHACHPDPYFGFAKVKVIPRSNDILGLLPSRDEFHRLVFSVEPKVGFWSTEELYLAEEQGYQIMEIYQVIHFTAENRSTTCFRGYMEHFLRIKQESEGWKKLGASSEFPSEEEKEEVIEHLYQLNGNIGRIRKEKVQKNPVRRQISKIFLNCLWGKFGQKTKAEAEVEIDNPVDFEILMEDNIIDRNEMTIRKLEEGRFKIKYTVPSHCAKPNSKYNVFIAAMVTAQARCILHRQMIHIGPERMLYCDTDSLIFIHAHGKQFISGGLGNWTDEYPEDKIVSFYAVAPKCYMIETENDRILKSKGALLTIRNKSLMTPKVFQRLIYSVMKPGQKESIQLFNMTIFPNVSNKEFEYAQMMTRYNTKEFRAVFTKRDIEKAIQEESLEEVFARCSRIRLFPIGYNFF